MNTDHIASAVESALERGPQALASALERLAGEGAFTPAMFTAPRAERYTRNLIHEDPAGRFVVLGCTWAPGQGSCLHDHCGFIGAEMVISGAMEETIYELKESGDDGLFRFVRGRTRYASVGAIGTIVPPEEYHDFGNPGSEPATTLHVYGGNLTSCRVFGRADEIEWWRAKTVSLSYDGNVAR